MKKGDYVYYARIIPSCRIYDVFDLRVRTVKEDYFVAVEKRDKRAYLFNMNQIGKEVFLHRHDALELVMQKENGDDEDIENNEEESSANK